MWRNKKNFIFISLLILCILILVGNNVCKQLIFNEDTNNQALNFGKSDLSIENRSAYIKENPANFGKGEQEADNETENGNNIEKNETNQNNNFAIKQNENKINDNLLYIKAVGDIMLGRGIEYHLIDEGKDYKYPFENVVEFLKTGDIIFGNLEAPLTDNSNSLDPNGKYVLKNRSEAIEGLKYAGFNILNLANNHIMDYYYEGLKDTIEILEEYEIQHCGAGENIEKARNPAILDIKGFKIAVLGYTDMAEYFYKGNPMIKFEAEEQSSGVAPRKLEYIKEDIEKIKENADIIIISLHWGIEDSFDVTEEQRQFAYELIDNGADIILGHHPHKFQGIEIYKGKPIIYSMGNFIFDQNDPLKQEAFMVDIVFDIDKLTSLELIPIRTISKTHVIIPKQQDAADMLKRELELCGKLGSKCAIIGDKIVFNLK